MVVKLKELIDGYRLESIAGSLDCEVSLLCDDSRKATPDSMFFAVKGTRVDGNSFIQDALERGARVVVSEEGQIPDGKHTFLKVGDIYDAMAFFSDRFYRHPSGAFRLIGITGTNGKTTTAGLIYQMLRRLGKTAGLIGTIRYITGDSVLKARLTTPTAIEFQQLLSRMRDSSIQYVISEVSSHALDQKRVDYSDFDVAVYTNLSRDHLDYHNDMEAYFRAKRRLFFDFPVSVAVINADDPYGSRMLEELKDKEVISYGLSRSATIHADRITASTEGIRCVFNYSGKGYDITTGLLGLINVYNLLAATSALLGLGFDINEVVSTIAFLEPAEGRMELIDEGQPFTVLVDYAHTPDALQKLLETVRGLDGKRVITVFGCGGDRDRGKRPLMGEVASSLSDMLFITSDNPRTEPPEQIIDDILKGVKNHNFMVVVDRKEAITKAIQECQPGDVLVIAGKGHEDYQEIYDQRIPFDDRRVVREVLRQRFSNATR